MNKSSADRRIESAGPLRLLLFACGFLSLALGLLGVLLPVLPTSPFVLLSVACFARSSPRWHRWLIQHPLFGPPIRDWQEARVIRTKAKVIATLSILALGIPTILWLSHAPYLGLALSVVFGGVLAFIWTRRSTIEERSASPETLELAPLSLPPTEFSRSKGVLFSEVEPDSQRREEVEAP